MRSIGPSTFNGSITSWRMSEKPLLPSRWATFATLPVMRLSTPTTVCPCESRRSVRCEPKKPAAPETRILMWSVVRCQLSVVGAVILGQTFFSTDDGPRTTDELIGKSEPDDSQNRLHPVFPGDLLPFLVAAAVISHTNLINPKPRAHLGDLGGHLGLEAEPVALDVDPVDHVLAEHLVADLHVRQVQVGEHVAHGRQEPVAHRVPEVEHAMRLPDEPAAVHDVGLAVEDGLEELAVILGVVFE